MSSYLNPALSTVPVDQFIQKIVVMCDEHGAKWGTPQSLAGFVRALHTNKHLAMDFWSVVARISEEGSSVGPEPNRVLEVIVEGVTGRSVAEVVAAGKMERQAVSELSRLLAGEDIWSPAIENPENARRVEVVEVSRVQKAQVSKGVRRGEDLSGDRLSGDEAAQVRKDARDSVRKDARDSEELVREAVPPPAQPPSSPSYVNAPVSSPQYYESFPDGRREDHRRLFLEPEPLLAQELPSQQEPAVRRYDPPIRIPLAEYEEMGKNRKAVVITLLLLLMVGSVGGWAFFKRGGGIAYWQRLEAMINRARSGDAARESVPSSVDSSSATNTSSPVTSGNESEGSGSNQANGVSEAPSAPAPAPEVHAAATVRAATREEANRRTNSPPTETVGSTGPLVQVPAEVMQARLISSRVPVYPEAARADHVEGRVVMQAIVTKDGAVGHLHIASGNSSLRAAAMEAVSAWRYRPYMVNGEPVEVLTTISVDFLVN